MNEFVHIKFTNKELIDGSKCYKEFISNLNDKKVDMEFLRKIYIEDTAKFYKLVQELVIRGCKFQCEKENSLLPSIDFKQNIGVLLKKNDEKVYKNINFDKYGLGNFTLKFNIESDKFFNGIYIEGFKFLNSTVDLNQLKEEFKLNGFCIVNEEEFENFIKKYSLGIDNAKHTLHKNFLNEISSNRILIETVMHLNKFNSFRKFCKENNIVYIDEINDEIIEKYSLFKGVGQTKVNQVVDFLGKGKFNDNESPGQVISEYTIDTEGSFTEQLKIKDIFNNPKYLSFVEFCKNNNIVYLGDTDNKTIYKYSISKGIGSKRVNDVKEYLNNYISYHKEKLDEVLTIRFEWYEVIKEYKIKDMCEITNIQLDFNLDMKIKDIQGKTLNELNLQKNKSLLTLVDSINEMYTPFEFIKNLEKESKLNEREILFIQKRYGEALTLAEISNLDGIGLTRERVRQLLKKAGDKIRKYAIERKFIESLKILTGNKEYFTCKQLYSMLNHSYNEVYLKILYKDANCLHKVEALDIIHFNLDDRIENKIHEIIAKLPKLFKLEDELENMTKGLEFISLYDMDIANIEKLLIYNGYKPYGEYYSKHTLTMREALKILLENYIENSFYYDENAYEELQQLCKKYLNLEITSGFRTFENILRDTEELVLVDSRTYMPKRNLEFKPGVDRYVKSILEKELETIDVVNSLYIFNKYEKELKQYGINNKYFLYTVVSIYLTDNFSIGKGNSLDISKSVEGLSITREESIINLLNENNGCLDRLKIGEILNWNMYKVDDTVGKSDKILRIGNNIVNIDKLSLTKSIEAKLYEILNRMIIKGYSSSYEIIEEMRIDPEMYDFLCSNNINDANSVSNLLRVMIKDSIKVKGNFITKINEKYECIEDVIADKFRNDTFTRNDVKDFILSLGYADVYYNSTFRKLLKNDKIVRIDDLEYIYSNEFRVDEDSVNKLVSYIEEKLGDKSYISLNTLSGYKRNLPRIEYRWNVHLMASILRENGYRQIERIYGDAISDRVIIVRNDNPIKTFDELVYKIIKEEYDGNMHEVKIYEFLSSIGIVKEHEFLEDKTLPHELKISDKFKIDDVGRVEII
ncbi:sigma factor-like helix-turn-helix DNA-binding protein [Paraclostridium sordellii]|uniref:sigma factor-like helix-turn-helix DNA-binding protein n=1 Tax=Paraclostridium sordellii TaxID=1505 RepID=UPI0005DD632C|nr:sigma factor-like helix-turn-helix DNA-binding protein [Paeniclostridium sordellii]CEN87592.1 RNA polymerase sigma factor [[Clostridium] sordellii] [Paeniclostridium sordellii]